MRQYPLVGVLGRRVALAEVAECLPELLCGRCDQVVQRSSVVVLVVALRGARGLLFGCLLSGAKSLGQVLTKLGRDEAYGLCLGGLLLRV